MKALPTRKGNKTAAGLTLRDKPGLNESPAEKEGKCEEMQALANEILEPQ